MEVSANTPLESNVMTNEEAIEILTNPYAYTVDTLNDAIEVALEALNMVISINDSVREYGAITVIKTFDNTGGWKESKQCKYINDTLDWRNWGEKDISKANASNSTN